MAGRSLGPNRAQQLLRDVAPLADHIWFLLYDTALYDTALYGTALYDTDTPSAHRSPRRSATPAHRWSPTEPPLSDHGPTGRSTPTTVAGPLATTLMAACS